MCMLKKKVNNFIKIDMNFYTNLYEYSTKSYENVNMFIPFIYYILIDTT